MADVDVKAIQDEVKDPWWYKFRQLLHPNTMPGLLRRKYHERRKYLHKIRALLDKIQQEEEIDWNTVDEDGNPAQVVLFTPRFIRRRYRFFMLVYWDPLMDLLEKVP